VHDRPDLTSPADDLGHRLHRAHLVVGNADRDQRGACRDRVGIGAGGRVDGRDGDGVAVRLQAANGAQDGLVLGGPGDDAGVLRQAARGAEDREVDGFGAGRSECDLRPVGIQRIGDRVACAVEDGAGGAAFGVQAGRVGGRQVADGFGDLGQDGRRPGVVQINSFSAPGRASLSRGCGRAGGEDP